MPVKKLRPYQEQAVEELTKHNKGICVLPTSAGKTTIFIEKVKRRMMESSTPLHIVVVAPKILLCNQLAEEFKESLIDIVEYFTILVHSGEGGITNSNHIQTISRVYNAIGKHQIMFTTYKSLMKIHDANIHIDVAIFDEAHHSTTESNYVGVAQTSATAKSTFFFTATIKDTKDTKSMLNSDTYGGTIFSLSPKELVNGGYILPPKVQVKKFEVFDNELLSIEVDCKNIIETIDETSTTKILVCAKSTNQLIELIGETNFVEELKERDFSYLYITSKTGAVIDGKKVDRIEFFDTLNSWGKIPNKKFIVMHRSILSEGISISELETVIFLRNMNIIEMTQSIGRVLRKSGPSKKFGLCVVPVYSNVGISTEKRLQSLIDFLFEGSQV
jgi:superfamily II DNA or RNA helicase